MNLVVQVGGGAKGVALLNQGTAVLGEARDGPIDALSVNGVGDYLLLDDNHRLLVGEASRGARWQASFSAALGVGGTQNLIAAPGAGLVRVVRFVQLQASLTTTLTIESPASTVLWTTIVPAGGVLTPIELMLFGQANQAIVIRTAAAATITCNGQGFTEVG